MASDSAQRASAQKGRDGEPTGTFDREESRFRNWITKDGKPGPSGKGGFVAEPDRYQLYGSLACPWSHRTFMMRRLKGIESLVPLSILHWHMGKDGWTFAAGQCVTPDPIFGAATLREIYRAAVSDYRGRVTVPVLWDKKTSTIVSNESAEILRMFNDAFDDVGARAGDYYPEPLRAEIDTVNELVYRTVNNGVYRVGFATTQEAYNDAVARLFETFDWLEERLQNRDYLVGDRFTEADIRLFVTLIRFDVAYHGHFKCNLRRLVDYPALWRYTRKVYAMPGVSDTVNFDHIKQHYYRSHPQLDPTGIVPAGPVLDLALRESSA